MDANDALALQQEESRARFRRYARAALIRIKPFGEDALLDFTPPPAQIEPVKKKTTHSIIRALQVAPNFVQ